MKRMMLRTTIQEAFMKSTGRISWILMCGAALAGVVAQADDGGTAWRQNFTNMPPSWSVEGKPSVSKALFTAGYTDGTNCVLRLSLIHI